MKKTVFIDSSVFFTAVNSPTGGSAKLYTLKNIDLISSPLVLAEVERNVRQKLFNYHLDRFFLLASMIKIIKQSPNNILIQKAKKIIVAKDAVILAEAKLTKANFLVTLDKKHFFTQKACNFFLPGKIVTPKILLNSLN